MQRNKLEDCLDELDYGILQRITDIIGRDWRRFVQVIPGYSTYDVESFAVAYHTDEKPAMRILTDLMRQGKTVRHLISYLEKIKLENALLLLKGPERLRLTKAPEGGSFVEDGPMRLECNATGFPYPRYQWLHIYATEDNKQYHHPLTEGTDKALVIDLVRPEHSGAYYCRIYHYPTADKQEAFIATEPVMVRVTPSLENTAGVKPIITKQPRSITVVKGKPVALECKADGRPEPTYMWFRRGHDNKKLRVREKIKWDQANPNDAGVYSCRVRNRCGEVWSDEATITVTPRGSVDKDVVIKIDRQPVDSECLVGEKHVMECQAVCKVPLFYQWYKEDKELPGFKDNKLTFDPVTAKDEGRYFCKIWNQSGCNQQSNFVHLSLKYSSVPSVPGEGYCANDKIALLIGNMSYRGCESLTAVSHDVSLLQKTLTNLGFRFLSFMDLDKADMERAVDLFCDLITENSYVVFYFSGHGFQHLHQTYMVPVDAQTGYDSSQCICVQDVHRKFQMKRPALNNMNLDICRCSNENETRVPSTRMHTAETVLGNTVIFCASNVGSEALESVGRDGSRPKGIFTDHFTKRIVQKEPLTRILEHVRTDVGNDPQVTTRQFPELQTDLRFPLSLHDPIKNQSPEAQRNATVFWNPLYLCGRGSFFAIDHIKFDLFWTWTFSNVIRVEIRHNAGCNLEPIIRVIPETLYASDQTDKDLSKEVSPCSVWHISRVQKATEPLTLVYGVEVNGKFQQRKILFPEPVILRRWNSYRLSPIGTEKDFSDQSSGGYSTSSLSSSSTIPLCRPLETMSLNNA